MKTLSRMIAGAMLSLPMAASADATVYVQSMKAKLLSAPQFGAAAVVEVNRGDALRVLESQERWCRVQSGDKNGWVSKLVVSERAPLNRTTALTEQPGAGLENARRRASAATTAGAARGLTYEDRMRASQAGVGNYAALERMESTSVSEQEALAFVAEGLKQ